MFALLILGSVFAPAFAVTFYAILTAKEGFEDHRGFHLASESAPQRAEAGEPDEDPSARIPPFAPAG